MKPLIKMMFFRFLEEDFTIKEGEIKMKKYIILESSSKINLESAVNEHLKKG